MTTARKSALEFELWRVVNRLYTPILRKPGDKFPTHEEIIKRLIEEIEKENERK